MGKKRYSLDEFLKTQRAKEEKIVEELAKNYNPDKKNFYASEKNKIKDIKFERNYLNKNYDERKNKRSDLISISERREKVLNGQIEKKAIETFKSFTPEEVEIKIDNVKYFANNTKDLEELKTFEKNIKIKKGICQFLLKIPTKEEWQDFLKTMK